MQRETSASPVVYARHTGRSFLSTLALGASAVAVTVVISGAAILLYGMNIADRKSENVLEAVEAAVRGLPELRESLPPVLADVLDDERRPDYVSELTVSARLARTRTQPLSVRPVIEVENTGSEMVSLLSMNVTLLDANGLPLTSWTVWAATPFAADEGWVGPLLPGASRSIAPGARWLEHGHIPLEGLDVRVDISDVRVWTGRHRQSGQRQQAL